LDARLYRLDVTKPSTFTKQRADSEMQANTNTLLACWLGLCLYKPGGFSPLFPHSAIIGGGSF
jgi:hypothetical protein